TGESGCCRPTPYHLATAPYLPIISNKNFIVNPIAVQLSLFFSSGNKLFTSAYFFQSIFFKA
ncbi:MAG: hypothetical protein NC400_14320, partial [Clostridium sp.]|nr:hypothetical protein [Clostridium sp.]